MENLRMYGREPFGVAVIHGGPGAPGTMAPVARELAARRGVLEPLQTAATLDGQVQELRAVLEEKANLPVALIGSSWGAMLSFIFAARYPNFVKKLIMVGSGVFEQQYAAQIHQTRLSRMSEAERQEANALMEQLNDPALVDQDTSLAQLGRLFNKVDAYDPLTLETEIITVQYEINQSVWREAEELRRGGELLALGKRIQCPVVAIHGDYDPHPYEGVERPLSRVLKNWRFVLLKNCGHLPWLEREAKDKFYEILQAELDEPTARA